MAAPQKPPARPQRLITDNRRAFHEYHILDRFDAGLVLTGTEVKSLRMGKVNLTDAFARIEDGEVWVYHMHVAPYTHGNIYNVDPMRRRKVLLKKAEISRLLGKTREQGLTLIPLKLYWDGDWAKVELGLAKGKKLHDKRDALAKKDTARDVARELKERSKY
ncbi:MAG: SsrA-binding protein SmpB [Candidatus Sericytochromatia bacterium]|nr:SsrA-binding protein SmpB [Candidatus Sericytochromatia bacterium]